MINSFLYTGALSYLGSVKPMNSQARFVKTFGISPAGYPNVPSNFSRISSTPLASDFNVDTTMPIVFYSSESFISKTSITYLGVRMVGDADNTLSFGESQHINFGYSFQLVYTFTPSGAPSAPINFSGASINSDSIIWNWNDSSDQETGFQFRTGTFETISSRGVNLRPVTIIHVESSLLPNTLYTRNVAASNSLGLNSTPNLSVATKIEDITDASLISSSNSIAVQVNNNLSNLALGSSGVTYTLGGSGSAGPTTVKFATHTFNGLSPNSEYTVTLQPRNQQSVVSLGLRLTTFTLANPASNVSLSDVGFSSFTVLWNANGNPLTVSYDVQWSTYSDFSLFVESTTVNSPLLIDGLEHGATYFIRVKSVNSRNLPTFSSSVQIRTLAPAPRPQIPAPPIALPVLSIGQDSMTGQWGYGSNPSETAYLIDVATSSDIIPPFDSSGWRNGINSYQFSALSNNTTYWLRVKARNTLDEESGFTFLGSTPTLSSSPPDPIVVSGFDPALGDFLRIIPSFGANHPDTELAIQNSNGQYLQGNGRTQTGEIWKTKSEWESGFSVNIETIPVNIPSQQYRVYSRNFGRIKNLIPSNLVNGPVSPLLTILSRELLDLNSDGRGETLRLTFSQPIVDSSFVPADVILDSGLSVSLSTAPGDAANDAVINLQLSASLPSDSTPNVRYQGGGLTAQSGRRLTAETVSTPASDSVAPVMETLSAALFGGRTLLRVRFSESVSAASVPNLSSWAAEAPLGTVVPLSNAIFNLTDAGRGALITLPHEVPNASAIMLSVTNISDAPGNTRPGSSLTTRAILNTSHSFLVARDVQGRRAQGPAVDPSAHVMLFFDREMVPASVRAGFSLTLVHDKLGNSVLSAISGTLTELPGNQMFSFIPNSPLPKGSRFRAALSSAVADAFDVVSGAESSWEFATPADYTERSVLSPLPGFKVTVPPGTFSQDAGLALLTDPAANALHTDRAVIAKAFSLEQRKAEQAGSGTHAPIPNLAFEIVGETSQGGIIQGALGNSVQITMNYPDANNDGIVDGTSPGVAAKDLTLYFLDESLREFRKIPSQVDTTAKTITASLKHFSIYAVMGALATSVESFLVRPNLWQPAQDPAPIILDNLPDPAEVSIYSVTGQKVISLQGNGNSAIEWRGVNDAGEALASGVYVAVLKGAGGTKSKKVTIVR